MIKEKRMFSSLYCSVRLFLLAKRKWLLLFAITMNSVSDSRGGQCACNGDLLRLHFNVLSNHDNFRGQIKMVSWFLLLVPWRVRSPSAVPEFAFHFKIIVAFVIVQAVFRNSLFIETHY